MEKKVIVIGHVDHGKTTFLEAVDRVMNNRVVEKEPIVAGKTVEYKIEEERYTLFDYPGQADYLKNIGKKAEKYAILVCSVLDGRMPDTTEQVLLCKEWGIEKIAVFFSKSDMMYDDEVFELMKEEMLTFLEENGYSSDMPVGLGSPLDVLESVETGKIESHDQIRDFLEKLHIYF